MDVLIIMQIFFFMITDDMNTFFVFFLVTAYKRKIKKDQRKTCLTGVNKTKRHVNFYY